MVTVRTGPASGTGARWVMTVAELSQISKRFGPVTALDHFDLKIEQGQVLALLGRNGAGKTTAARLLLGLSTPDEGQGRVFGRDPGERAARQRMGAILQAGRVPETLKVREHVALFASYYPRSMTVAAAVRAAGLEGLEDRRFGQLSGGQKQRVLFALALCGQPELLLLHEPTAGLDVESRRALWTHIRGFVARGGSVLLTTHYLEEDDALASRIAVVDRGRLIAEGTPAEIKKSIGLKRFSCSTSLSREKLMGLATVVSVTGDGQQVVLGVTDGDRATRALLAADPDLSGLEIQGAALEDASMAMTDGVQ